MPRPIGEAPDAAYTSAVNDMANVLGNVLIAGYAFYAIVRGHGPGIYRATLYVLDNVFTFLLG